MSIHIGKEVKALLDKLGLNGPDVAEFHCTPKKVTVTIFKRNERGEKYTEGSWEQLPSDDEDEVVSGFVSHVATETKEYAVHT